MLWDRQRQGAAEWPQLEEETRLILAQAVASEDAASSIRGTHFLDVATSALDSQSERLVQQAIEQFERQRTVLVIAHRLSTIVNADEILVLERGRGGAAGVRC